MNSVQAVWQVMVLGGYGRVCRLRQVSGYGRFEYLGVGLVVQASAFPARLASLSADLRDWGDLFTGSYSTFAE